MKLKSYRVNHTLLNYLVVSSSWWWSCEHHIITYHHYKHLITAVSNYIASLRLLFIRTDFQIKKRKKQLSTGLMYTIQDLARKKYIFKQVNKLSTCTNIQASAILVWRIIMIHMYEIIIEQPHDAELFDQLWQLLHSNMSITKSE